MYDRETNPQNENKRDLAGVWERKILARGVAGQGTRKIQQEINDKKRNGNFPHQYPRPNPRRKEKPSIQRPQGGIHGEARHWGCRVQNCIRMQCGVTTPPEKEEEKKKADTTTTMKKKKKEEEEEETYLLDHGL